MKQGLLALQSRFLWLRGIVLLVAQENNAELFLFSAKTSYVIMSNNCQHTVAYENVDGTVEDTYDTNCL